MLQKTTKKIEILLYASIWLLDSLPVNFFTTGLK